MRAGTAALLGGLVLVLAPLAYVLSIGPAVAMCPEHSSHIRLGPLDVTCASLEPALIIIYTPLIALRDTVADPALHRYVDLWE